MKRKVFDLETNGLLPELDRIHCMVIQDVGPTGEPVGPRRVYRTDNGPGIAAGLADLEDSDELIGHNIQGYDIPAILKLYPNSTVGGIRLLDTLIMSRAIFLDLKDRDFQQLKKKPNYMPMNLVGRHGLEAWGWRTGKCKGDYAKEMKAKGLDPWAEVNDKMVDYNELDVVVNVAVLLALYKECGGTLPPMVIEIEHAMADICSAQEQRGVWFDEKAAAVLYATLSADRERIHAGLVNAFAPWWRPDSLAAPKRTMRRWVPHPEGGDVRKKRGEPDEIGWFETITVDVPYTKVELCEFNPSSRPMIADRLIKVYGWKPTEFTDAGSVKVDEETLGGLKYPEAKRIVSYLTIDKRIGQLAEGKQAWLRLVKPDGRIYGRIDPNGTGTNRATHSSPNLAQVPKVKVGKVNGEKAILMGAAGGWGFECRSLFGATPFEFPWQVGADASGLELRMLAHYMARYDNGEYAKVILEGDIHAVNQQAAGLPTRDDAKTFIYAFLYGAGDELLGQIVGGGRREGAYLRKRFLQGLPALGYLTQAISDAAERGFLKTFDGRKIPVRSKHSALNFLLQGGGSVVMKMANVNYQRMLKDTGHIRGTHYNQILWVHDEFQVETKTEQMAHLIGSTMVDAIRQVTTDFTLRVPLDGEYKVGRNWAGTH